MEINMTEQQITDEVLRYLKDESYNYAVLIDGEWGSGKTYFVNHSLCRAIEKQEKEGDKPRLIKYISLYGCKSMADVQENIAWSFAENAREKIKDKASWGVTGEKVSGNILLSSKKIGNAILKKLLPETSIYEITSDWLNLGAFIFVFDDLERCDCPINEVFGFLNELVEHENTKVIIIANEKELSGVADIQFLEQQYLLTLDERIEWPKQEESGLWARRNNNSKVVSLGEMERRRMLLFPQREANSSYRKIREKLIGVSLKYEPNIPEIILEIIEATKYSDSIKNDLKNNQKSFLSTMGYYHHRNLRTFQFFLSKISFLLERLKEIDVPEEHYQAISNRIICEAFSQSVKFKSNYKPPRDNRTWLSAEQDTAFQSVKSYVETGTFDKAIFNGDVEKLETELAANIPFDDPYYLVYQQYYINTQKWCEEQLEKVLLQLSAGKYPVSFYGKIIVAIQRLIDLGFNDSYMDRAKKTMLDNISKMGEVNAIDPDIWYVDDVEFKEKISSLVMEINEAIKNHTEVASRENLADILTQSDWTERLDHYTNPNNDRYVKDMAAFAKAPVESWINILDKANPKEIDDFRCWLSSLYPRGVMRKSYAEDADTMKKIVDGLEKIEEKDLIKKAALGWVIYQINTIVEFHEPSNAND